MSQLLKIGVLLLLFGGGTSPAAERVTAFHSDIRIASSGELTITETIEVQAEGKELRQGILREFPAEYRDRLRNRVALPVEVVKVMRNQQPEPYAVERLAEGTRISTGEAGRLLPPGKHVYEISYRTARQIGYFDRHDELYWNVNGTGWRFSVDRLTAEVTFDRAVLAEDIKVEAHTGPQGPRGHDYNAFVRHGSAAFRVTRELAPREGMTIVVAFPKGVIASPSTLERSRSLFSANPGAAAGIAAYALMLALLFAGWWRFGRDRGPDPAFAGYAPLAGLGPAGLRFIDRQGYDPRCLTAALFGLGSRGYLHIRELGGRLRIERSGRTVQWFPGERALAKRLLPAGTAWVDLRKHHHRVLEEASAAFSEALRQAFGPSTRPRNSAAIFAGAAIGIAGVVAMIVLEAPVLAVALVIAAMLATLALFAVKLLRVNRVQGRKLEDQIDVLRQYFSVAEADDMDALPQTKEVFSHLLPYAVALGAEKTWAQRFAAALGVEAVAAAVAGYYSGGDGPGDVASFTDSISSMAETIASASTPGSDPDFS